MDDLTPHNLQSLEKLKTKQTKHFTIFFFTNTQDFWWHTTVYHRYSPHDQALIFCSRLHERLSSFPFLGFFYNRQKCALVFHYM